MTARILGSIRTIEGADDQGSAAKSHEIQVARNPGTRNNKSHERNRAREAEIKPVSKLANHSVVNFTATAPNTRPHAAARCRRTLKRDEHGARFFLPEETRRL